MYVSSYVVFPQYNDKFWFLFMDIYYLSDNNQNIQLRQYQSP
jgi:hypothetical protein